MSRSLKVGSLFVVAMIVSAALSVAAFALTAKEQPAKKSSTDLPQTAPLGFDQTEYRRENGQWRMTVDSVERPYV